MTCDASSAAMSRERPPLYSTGRASAGTVGAGDVMRYAARSRVAAQRARWRRSRNWLDPARHKDRVHPDRLRRRMSA